MYLVTWDHLACILQYYDSGCVNGLMAFKGVVVAFTM